MSLITVICLLAVFGQSLAFVLPPNKRSLELESTDITLLPSAPAEQIPTVKPTRLTRLERSSDDASCSKWTGCVPSFWASRAHGCNEDTHLNETRNCTKPARGKEYRCCPKKKMNQQQHGRDVDAGTGIDLMVKLQQQQQQPLMRTSTTTTTMKPPGKKDLTLSLFLSEILRLLSTTTNLPVQKHLIATSADNSKS